jgi:hypothetical protein
LLLAELALLLTGLLSLLLGWQLPLVWLMILQMW